MATYKREPGTSYKEHLEAFRNHLENIGETKEALRKKKALASEDKASEDKASEDEASEEDEGSEDKGSEDKASEDKASEDKGSGNGEVVLSIVSDNVWSHMVPFVPKDFPNAIKEKYDFVSTYKRVDLRGCFVRYIDINDDFRFISFCDPQKDCYGEIAPCFLIVAPKKTKEKTKETSYNAVDDIIKEKVQELNKNFLHEDFSFIPLIKIGSKSKIEGFKEVEVPAGIFHNRWGFWGYSPPEDPNPKDPKHVHQMAWMSNLMHMVQKRDNMNIDTDLEEAAFQFRDETAWVVKTKYKFVFENKDFIIYQTFFEGCVDFYDYKTGNSTEWDPGAQYFILSPVDKINDKTKQRVIDYVFWYTGYTPIVRKVDDETFFDGTEYDETRPESHFGGQNLARKNVTGLLGIAVMALCSMGLPYYAAASF